MQIKVMKSLALLSAVLAFTVMNTFGAPEVGKPAPDFTGVDSNGVSHKLSDLKGKYVVLEWLNHGCPFVKKHYSSKNMQGTQKFATDKGVVWFSIVSSAPGKQGNMTPMETNAKKTEVGSNATAIIIDENGEIGQLYGAKTTPDMFIINPKGDLIYSGAIDDKASTDVSDIAGAKNYVKVALEEAMNGTNVTESKTKSYGCSVKY